MYDEDLEAEPFVDDSPGVAAQETPFLEDAESVAEKPSLSPAASDPALQPNAAQETTPDHDEAFKSETVVKDYKSWQRINQEVAEFTGKSVDEIKALPFDERMTMLAETRKSLTDKLDALSEYENFIGIKVDAPADRWDSLAEQLSALPEKHYDKIVDTVFRTQLPTLIETAIGDPKSYPDEFALLDSALTRQFEQMTGRDAQTITNILALTQNISPQQLYNILQGQGGGQAQQPYASQPQTAQPNTPQQSQSAMLLSSANSAHAQAQALVNAGYEEGSQEVQSWLVQETNLRYAAVQAGDQERREQATATRLADIEGRISKTTETEAQKTSAQVDKQYDEQATAARNGALDSVVKGRVSEDDKELYQDVREAIDARAERTLKANVKALQALSDAKDWHKDKAEAKARGEMAKYLAAVSVAYNEAGSHILNRFVVPKTEAQRKADKQKAARREIGLNGTARPNATPPSPLNGRSMRDEDVGDAAFELYKARTG